MSATPMTVEALDVLHTTREWLSDSSHWRQLIFATKGGEFCEPKDADSTCLLGGVARYLTKNSNCMFEEGIGAAIYDHLHRVTMAEYGLPPAPFNDLVETTHADVLGMLDLAIGKAEAELGVR